MTKEQKNIQIKKTGYLIVFILNMIMIGFLINEMVTLEMINDQKVYVLSFADITRFILMYFTSIILLFFIAVVIVIQLHGLQREQEHHMIYSLLKQYKE